MRLIIQVHQSLQTDPRVALRGGQALVPQKLLHAAQVGAVVKQMGSGDRYIYVYQQDGTVKFQKVELGRRMSDRYEITAGLADGDEIVVKGQNALNNGVSVERVNE